MASKKNNNSNSPLGASKSREFLYRQIANELRKEIDSGVYTSGSRLPSMDDMAAKFKVNKITVLKALDELKNEGVIYSIPAQGTYVTEINTDKQTQKKNSTFTVGLLSHVLSPSEFGPYHMGIVNGIQDKLGRKNGNLLLMPAGNLQTDSELYQLAMEAPVDAMIYLGPFTNSLLDRLIKTGPPAVVVDYSFKGCTTDSVLVDNVSGGYLIMDHLLQLGHDKIALIGTNEQTAAEERATGIAQALENKKKTLDDLIVFPGKFKRENGYDATCTILKEHKDCTAICCMNDEMAAGALQAIYTCSDLKVPQDISVTGFDDVQLSAATHPPLTSVHVDIRHMGKIAVQRLMDRVKEPQINPTSTLISTQLITRESTCQPS